RLDKADVAGMPERGWQLEAGVAAKLVGLQPVDPSVVPEEASLIVDGAEIAGRITSSRMSPTLRRSICLAQVEARLADPGTVVTVRLPSGRLIQRRGPPRPRTAPPAGGGPGGWAPGVGRGRVARSPIAPAPPVTVRAGWEVSGRRAGAAGALTLTDCTPLTKVQLRAPVDGEVAAWLGVPFGRAARDP